MTSRSTTNLLFLGQSADNGIIRDTHIFTKALHKPALYQITNQKWQIGCCGGYAPASVS